MSTTRKNTVKITPKPKFTRQGVDFATLEPEDWFLFEDSLCIKLSSLLGNGMGLDISDGGSYSGMCGTFVLPVDVEIKWTKKIGNSLLM